MQFEKEQAWRRLNDPGEYNTWQCQAADEVPDLAVGEVQEQFRYRIQQLLWSRPVLIEFVKADGQTRVMECTLSNLYGAEHTSQLDAEPSTKSDQHTPQWAAEQSKSTQRKINTDACAVWDIKQGAWRSFRWDRLKRVDFKVI